AHEAIVKYDIALNPKLSRQGLQLKPILVAFATPDVGMCSSNDHVNHFRMLGNDLWQCFDDPFNSLVRRQKSKRKQHGLAFSSRSVLVVVGISKRKVGNSVRDNVDLIFRNVEDSLQ